MKSATEHRSVVVFLLFIFQNLACQAVGSNQQLHHRANLFGFIKIAFDVVRLKRQIPCLHVPANGKGFVIGELQTFTPLLFASFSSALFLISRKSRTAPTYLSIDYQSILCAYFGAMYTTFRE